MTDRSEDNRHALASAAVVVGTDGSEPAAIAVRWAARTASDRGRRLLIVHGIDLANTRATFDNSQIEAPSIIEAFHNRGARLLSEAEALAREIAPTVEIGTDLADDNPARRLIALSERAHMVVLGAAARVGPFAHLGSTLLAVTAHAHGAVVVVRGGPSPDRAPVVVGVDAGAAGEPAIEAAFAEAAVRGVDLVAVHAWSDLSSTEFAGASYVGTPPGTLLDSERALLAERLAGWQERYPNVTVTRHVYLSGPREQLGEWSREAQLLVVGSRGRGGFRSLLLGSTSNWLVQHADCPVMVVHAE
ncbi:universal stress protein [Nocardia higoensis]|uniref:universal stress protein n=1 Tax=Nocardia higoensis TaxID=228599 RepID=UPI0002D45788|nr:universal stress protein [Nocardia higoensis]